MSANKKWIDFKTIKQEASFEQVLAHYQIGFKSGDSDFKVTCPFHDDSKPSCSINPKKKIFQCFSCSAKGNILDFVCQMEDTTSLRTGAKVLQSIIGETNVVPIKQSTAKKRDFAADFETGLYPPEDEIEDELRPEVIPEGYIYIGNGKLQHVKKTLAQCNENHKENGVIDFQLKLDHEHTDLQMHEWFTTKTAKRYGIGVANRGIMKGRICFPIRNKYSELVAYAGRWPNDDIPEGEGKYKLPKGFQKSLELYLFSEHFGEHSDPEGTIIIVEGYWGAVMLSQAGYPAVAIMGRKISQEQINLITSTYSITNAIVVMDGDEPGREAEPEIVLALSRILPTRCISLEDGTSVDQDISNLAPYLKDIMSGDIVAERIGLKL